jgi:hypothetical protein
MTSKRLVLALLALLAAPPLWAANITLQQYTAHLNALRSLALNCSHDSSSCDPARVGDDDVVSSGPDQLRFDARFDWLRDALTQARKSKDRPAQMTQAVDRLNQMLQDAATPAAAPIAPARAKADAILAGHEFAAMTQDSLSQRIIARIFLWIDEFLGHMASFGKRSPWVGPLFEWGLLAIALTGLVLWAMRAFRRQRLALSVETSRHIEAYEDAARDWLMQAEQQANAGRWREAVHCLYWATIVMLEGRRMWRSDRARTPREYLRLLEAGSPRWTLLRRQTLGFERIWYGLNPADSADYRSALEAHEQLRTA